VQFVCFLDEVNTAAILGACQDVIVDGRFLGEPLPDNIFFVCASNPYRLGESISEAELDQGDVSFRSSYQVRPPPPGLQMVEWHYGPMSTNSERDYIRAKLRNIGVRVAVDGDRRGIVGEGSAEPVTLDEWTKPCAPAKAGDAMLPPMLPPGVTVDASTVAAMCDAPVAAVDADIPMAMSESECRFLGDIVGTAHQFVRQHKGDRCAGCVCVGSLRSIGVVRPRGCCCVS
jgi:hypothetical protein